MFSSFSTTMAMVLFCIGAATSLQIPASSWGKMQEAPIQQQGNSLWDENLNFMRDLFKSDKSGREIAEELGYKAIFQLAQIGTGDDGDGNNNSGQIMGGNNNSAEGENNDINEGGNNDSGEGGNNDIPEGGNDDSAEDQNNDSGENQNNSDINNNDDGENNGIINNDDIDDILNGDMTRQEVRHLIRQSARAFADRIGEFVGNTFVTALLAWTGRGDEIMALHPEFLRMRHAISVGMANFVYNVLSLPMFIVFTVFGFLGFMFSIPGRIISIPIRIIGAIRG